jgi:hypothetical protein
LRRRHSDRDGTLRYVESDRSFLFQLLASLAELEKSTISERTSRGRDRVNAHGKWTCGPIPYGYDLDDKGHLIPSERRVDTRGMTEAELVADIFTRIARGEATINSEYQRLNTLGIPREMRYGGEKARVRVNPRGWQFSSLHQLLHNPIYTGEEVLDSRFSQVTCPAPALVDGATWEAAQAALLRNRTLATRNAKRDYPLPELWTLLLWRVLRQPTPLPVLRRHANPSRF